VHQHHRLVTVARTETTAKSRRGWWNERNTDAGWAMVPKCLLTCLWLGLEWFNTDKNDDEGERPSQTKYSSSSILTN